MIEKTVESFKFPLASDKTLKIKIVGFAMATMTNIG